MRRPTIEYQEEEGELVEARTQLEQLGLRGLGTTRRGAQENLRWRLQSYARLIEQALARLRADIERDVVELHIEESNP